MTGRRAVRAPGDAAGGAASGRPSRARAMPAPRIVTTLDAALQGAIERLAAQERAYFDDGASARHRRGREQDAQRARLCRRHGLLGQAPGRSIWRNARARRARRSSPSSTASPSTISSCIRSSRMDDAPTKFGDYAPRDFDGGVPGRGDRARCAAHVAQRAGGDGARPRRPARLHADAAERRRASRLPDARRDAEPAGRARRSRHQPRRHHDALCRHRRRRTGASACAIVADAPDAPKPSSLRPGRGLVSARDPRRRVVARRLGDGAGPQRAAAPSASRPARPTASAMRGRSASRTTTRSASGSAAPTARRAPAASAARAAAPILLKTFELLPADKRARAARSRRRDHGGDDRTSCRRNCASSRRESRAARAGRRRRAAAVDRRSRPTARPCRCPRRTRRTRPSCSRPMAAARR